MWFREQKSSSKYTWPHFSFLHITPFKEILIVLVTKKKMKLLIIMACFDYVYVGDTVISREVKNCF